ncbi:hypothetical protein EDC04DRAFT_2574215 [Pisolithus marmoratus]|nr:hypothetical protein EDC04DRAFT_2574215 [Pisolithus marmoratus]
MCVNRSAAILYSLYLPIHHGEIPLFSTHDLPCIQYNATDNILWRMMSWMKYWEKLTWILPIHWPSPCGHWVMCTIDLVSQCFFLFDSFVEERPWKQEIQVGLF